MPAPGPTGLPQPTAPFSTPRPANLGDRIIHPVASTALPRPDLGSLIDQELNRAQAPTLSPTPAAPPQPAFTQSQQPAVFAQQQPPAFPQPPVAPAIASATPLLPTEMHGATAINFDDPNGSATSPSSQPGSPFNPADPAPHA
jgi:hypothetical protein